MSGEVTFSRFAHFDTNIMSECAKDRSLWPRLEAFLFDNDLCLAIGEGQVMELSSDDRLHAPLDEMLKTVPSAIIKTHDVILDEEVEAHPERRTATLLRMPITRLTNPDFVQFLSSPALQSARAQQRLGSQQWAKQVVDLRPNFLPNKAGRYTPEQASSFAQIITLQQLQERHGEFLRCFTGRGHQINYEVLKSAQIFGYVTFYKYYVAGRQPQPPNDHGDIHHLHALPYCKLVVTERNMCEILNQVKRNSNVLDGVAIKNISFLREWTWVEESEDS
jgi:hypothetical protein